MKDQLFIMEPGFVNAGLGPFYCGDSVSVEGFLGFFPQVRDLIDVHYIAFPRPRTSIVDLLGVDNQSVPVLVLAEGEELPEDANGSLANGRYFLSDEKDIRKYLSAKFMLPHAG